MEPDAVLGCGAVDTSDELPVLDPVAQRVLGSLMEKEVTVPASYPMTLNGLRTACNQSSSRDPVVDYDDRTIVESVVKDIIDAIARVP